MEALTRYPKHQRRTIAAEWGRRSQAVQAEARMQREPDFETLRMRALHDRRGELITEGVSYHAAGAKHWRIVRSVAGRVNQVDLIINGQPWRTGSIERAVIAVKTGKWRSWGRRGKKDLQ